MPDTKRTANAAGRLDVIDSLDAIALTLSMLWLGAMLILGWLVAEASLVTSLLRALVGATVVYAVVLVGLHVMISMAWRNSRRVLEKQLQEKRSAESAPPAGSPVEAAQ